MDAHLFMQHYSSDLFIAVFSLALLGIVSQQILFARIRKYHSMKWLELGEPGLWNMSQRSNWRFMRLLFKGDPELGGDMRVNGLIDLNRILAIITILAALSLFAVNVIVGMSMIPQPPDENGALLRTDALH